MKFFIILIICAVSSAGVNAQANSIFKKKPWEETKLKLLLQDTLSKLKAVPNLSYSIPRQTKNGVYHIPITGTYLGENGRGDEIYSMQPDNMPCLVPGKSFASEMPVLGMQKVDKSQLPLLKKGENKAGE